MQQKFYWAIGIVVVIIIISIILIPKGETIILTENQTEGPLLVKKIYSDRIEGINFLLYPVAGGEYPITLHIGESVGNGCTVALTLTKIEGKTATFTKYILEPGPEGCPRCLSESTFIDTPNGPVNVKDLKKGMTVWTTDISGSRSTAIVLDTIKREISLDHFMIHLVLNDGRELSASLGHPLADGRIIGELSEGDIVDGSKVATLQRVPYKGATYDILPSGGTGLYWANGILVKSTIFSPTP